MVRKTWPSDSAAQVAVAFTYLCSPVTISKRLVIYSDYGFAFVHFDCVILDPFYLVLEKAPAEVCFPVKSQSAKYHCPQGSLYCEEPMIYDHNGLQILALNITQMPLSTSMRQAHIWISWHIQTPLTAFQSYWNPQPVVCCKVSLCFDRFPLRSYFSPFWLPLLFYLFHGHIYPFIFQCWKILCLWLYPIDMHDVVWCCVFKDAHDSNK